MISFENKESEKLIVLGPFLIKNWSDAAQLNRDFNKLALFHSSYENYDVDKGTRRVARRWEAIHEV